MQMVPKLQILSTSTFLKRPIQAWKVLTNWIPLALREHCTSLLLSCAAHKMFPLYAGFILFIWGGDVRKDIVRLNARHENIYESNNLT